VSGVHVLKDETAEEYKMQEVHRRVKDLLKSQATYYASKDNKKNTHKLSYKYLYIFICIIIIYI
jgi:hypothetical protein